MKPKYKLVNRRRHFHYNYEIVDVLKRETILGFGFWAYFKTIPTTQIYLYE